jgi:hypothetical protein
LIPGAAFESSVEDRAMTVRMPGVQCGTDLKFESMPEVKRTPERESV